MIQQNILVSISIIQSFQNIHYELSDSEVWQQWPTSISLDELQIHLDDWISLLMPSVNKIFTRSHANFKSALLRIEEANRNFDSAASDILSILLKYEHRKSIDDTFVRYSSLPLFYSL